MTTPSDEVSIANGALILLGEEPILALTQNSKSARVMNQRYHEVRKRELRNRRWKFTYARASLPALIAAPLFGYAYQYQLPDDYIRLIDGGDLGDVADLADYRGGTDTSLYSIEGTKLLTDLGAPLAIRYISDVTDAGLFDASFVGVFSASLAYECCEAIAGSTEKQQLARQRYKDALRDGLRAGAVELPASQIADGEWISARLG